MTIMPIKQSQLKNTYSMYNSELLPDYQPEHLTADFWRKEQAITGSAQGRGTTYFIAYQQQQWVLRHYYRGGLIGKFNKDLYCFHSLEKTRAFQEFNLLQTMYAAGLPVPKPVACRVIKKGIFYRADLLTSRIENAKDLVAKLSKEPLSNENWQQIGKIVSDFHQQGIYHHDLNAHNILIDNNNVISVIDFDRGEQRLHNNKHWQEANIARLLRSFRKEKSKLPQFFWQENNWQQFMVGYNGK